MKEMNTAEIRTDILVIGTGPAGSACAALLATYGVEVMVVSKFRWLANTPRAHITNQRTMEVLRDLGREVENEAYLHATAQDLMGENVFCESLAGEEIGRMKSWGKHPLSRAAHHLASPSRMNDLPQTFMEPILYATACGRGAQGRMSTEYLRHEQDADGVTATLRDRLSGREYQVRAKYLVGADGGNSLVAEHIGTPIEGRMGVGGSMNILFRADLSRYVAHRPSVLYWVMQPGADVGGIGMGLVRMVRPWNEWLIVWGYDISEPPPEMSPEFTAGVVRQLVGDPELEMEIVSSSIWTVHNAYATEMRKGRVFIMGDAAHRHPPSNGLGSNTSIQDAYNLAWKLAAVLRGEAGEKLLESYTAERAPVARQIVTRANQSIAEFGPIFDALGMDGGDDIEKIRASMDARCDPGPDGEKQRAALRDAIAFKKYEFDAHGVEMNHRYRSSAVVADGKPEPEFERDAELHYQPTTWPGARLPHVWVYERDTGARVSTLDLCGGGRFTLFTGIGGEAWLEAAESLGGPLGLSLRCRVIGPRRGHVDHVGDWARAREISDTGCLLVRPDQHVAWRCEKMVEDPRGELERVLRAVLSR
ncbi:MAG: FAD-dependent monooxygenase [Alphaproteobacteria bacterium]|nr:FAD-dependent monooxygenase [Alphaproteobacteria bacterium]MDA8003313.1 FAD-dependent monooxygenase [Alphaproteobacteria bacterium]MDA8005021.1 FAD-dependent monooxygenase [Alphaproteobacteria bacterium]MDA8012367.1 FAD-dependent monooxygenase [Alphaproteobacteria bacterium]